MSNDTVTTKMLRELNEPAYERLRKRERGEEEKGEERVRIWADVLCYGDSLTFGLRHDSEDYPSGRHEHPWPTLLAKRLSPYYLRPIGSGVCSRTTCFDNPSQDDWCFKAQGRWFNGLCGLPIALLTHTPRWIVFMLGTNDTHPDVQKMYDDVRGHANASPKQRAREIAENVARLAEFAQSFNPRKGSNTNLFEEAVGIVVVTPPPLCLTEESREWGFDGTSVSIAKEFPSQFRAMCKEMGYLNAQPKQCMGIEKSKALREAETKARTDREKKQRGAGSASRGRGRGTPGYSELRCDYCLDTYDLRALKKNGHRKTTRRPPEGVLWACPECAESLDMSTSVDGVHFTEEHNEIVADAVWNALRRSADFKRTDALPKRIRKRARKIHPGEK
eukprot:g1533.t1